MNLLKIEITNFKNITEITVIPGGENVTFTGKNGAGKSAILDAFYTAVTGKKLDDPVKHGAERAEVKAHIGEKMTEYVVKRIWTQGGKTDRVEVVNAEGMSPVGGNQTFLNKFINLISFDPAEFTNMKDADRLLFLKSLSGLDTADVDAKYAAVYTERTSVNKELTTAKVRLKDAPQLIPDVPAETPDINAITDQIEKAEEVADENLSCQKDVKVFNDVIDVQKEKIAQAEAELERMKVYLTDRYDDLIVAELSVKNTDKAAIESVDTIVKLKEQLTGVSEVLKNQATNEARSENIATYSDDVSVLESQSKKLTDQLKEIAAQKAKAIAEANMPIDGLTIEDQKVIYNGTMYSMLSAGEKLRVSCAMAMALNPELKVICVRDASLLDEDGIAMIESIAAENKYQLLTEKVGGYEPESIHIVDGSIQTGAVSEPVDTPTDTQQ